MKTLVITEKPNVAERIANSLGKPKKTSNKGVAYYEVGDTIVAPTVGHIYGLAQADKKGWVYPVFNIEWVPSHEISKTSDFTKKYLDSIKKLAKGCGKFINACDYDVEGEVIGYNVIKYGCGADPHGENVGRVRYSTLTKESILKAFEKVGKIDFGLADAGITRHTLDWYWGINLSRALSNAARSGRHYATLSMGRVQGPTLRMLAIREHSIKAFKPETYWQLEMLCRKGSDFMALHERDKFDKKEDAEKAKEKCGEKAKVLNVDSKKYKQTPPHPFDLTTLQTEAYKHLNIDPRQTLSLAQDLYTNAYISYPRTSSQQIPEDIDCKNIITSIMRQSTYQKLCQTLLEKKVLKPAKGEKTDAAHPAIHPTGELPGRLDKDHQRLYDLIVRRFLACFGEAAVRQTVTVKLDNGGEVFIAKGNTTVEKGWHVYYGQYAKFEENLLPVLEKGEIVDVKDVLLQEKETKPPKRYTPASIIREMEKRNLGTKATRSQIVDILFRRGYIVGKSLEVTELGLHVVDAMDKYCPEVVSEKLTRKFEEEMEAITEGKLASEKVIDEGKKTLTKILEEFKNKEDKIGKALTESIRNSKKKLNGVGKCPLCNEELVIRKSQYNGQFIGCSGYPDCKNTWPLPKGNIKKSGKCEECGYATISISAGRGRAQKLCINPECPTKGKVAHLGDVGKCPKCGSEMIVRKSRYGTDFIGCSGYPNCKNIWGLPREEFTMSGRCDKCGYPKIKVKPERGDEYESCVNPGCEACTSVKKSEVLENVGKCPKCGSELLVRKSRYGTYFIGCSGYPKCRNIWGLPKDDFTQEGACEVCGHPKISVNPKKGEPFVSCVNTECEKYRKK